MFAFSPGGQVYTVVIITRVTPLIAVELQNRLLVGWYKQEVHYLANERWKVYKYFLC